MARSTPTSQTHLVTRADEALIPWHRALQWVTFSAALGMMLLSIVGIHWALTNILGIPGGWTWSEPPVAWLGGVIFEFGAAGSAALATTIKDRGARRSLWLVFGTLMGAMVAMNIGHALAHLAVNPVDPLPTGISESVVQVFAALIAALFPVCGTMLVHVSGVARAHSVDARWTDGREVRVAVDEDPSTTSPRAAARARMSLPAPAAPARAPQVRVEPERAPVTEEREPVVMDGEGEQRAYLWYVSERERGRKPQGSEVARALQEHGARATLVSNSQGTRVRARWEETWSAERAAQQPLVAVS